VDSKVSVFPIAQATTATFTELYFRLTFFFFIQRGSKYVLCPKHGGMLGEEGDLIIFPPGSMVTMENRPVMKSDYRALGVCYSHDLVNSVFSDFPKSEAANGVQIFRFAESKFAEILSFIQDTLDDDALPCLTSAPMEQFCVIA
jgi:hypothetical protein